MNRIDIAALLLACAAAAVGQDCPAVNASETDPSSPLTYPKISDRYAVQYSLNGAAFTDASGINLQYATSPDIPLPAAVSVKPASGSAANQVFRFTFAEPGGWQSLTVLNVLVNGAIDGSHACYLAIEPSGPAACSARRSVGSAWFTWPRAMPKTLTTQAGRPWARGWRRQQSVSVLTYSWASAGWGLVGARKIFGRDVAPGGEEGALEGGFPDLLQAHVGSSAESPLAFDRGEGIGVGFDESGLLLRCELHHGEGLIRIGEGGEDLAADAEIGVALVALFERLGEAEGNAPKVVGGHASSGVLRQAAYWTEETLPSCMVTLMFASFLE